MRPREVLARLNRAQRSMPFKIAASIIVVALAIVLYGSYIVSVKAPDAPAPQAQPGPDGHGEAAAPGGNAGAAGADAQELSKEEKSAVEAAQRLFNDLASRRADLSNVGIGIAAIVAIALVIIWLGVALNYLGIFALAGLVVLPMWLIAHTAYASHLMLGDEASLSQTLSGATRLILGAAALTAAFTALLSALRLAFSPSHPVTAIARNMIAEAVRMKISLVFIVILIFALAALPGTLSQDTPLRYRVQAFLQWGTGGSYWIIAILVLFFGAASVAFEQRDKQIWQTMTKPVAPWQYILGKWLGVSGLAAVLLAVCSAGVFLFTEYLRQQPAVGESAALVASGRQGITEDRMILEYQVLAARKSALPVIPMSQEDPSFQQALAQYIEQNRKQDPDFAKDQATFDKVVQDSWKAIVLGYFSAGPGQYRVFQFTGLQDARDRDVITLRYRIESGGNAPDQLYRITFIVGGVIQPPEECTLGPTHAIHFLPTIVDEKGQVEIAIYNGALVPQADGTPAIIPNAGTISFPTGGLELTYAAGSYRMNFVRVALVLWIKLAFLAMLAIAAATFLSFPVACLVAFSVFLVAEGASFLSNSLEYYDAVNPGDKIIYWKIPVRAVGLVIAWMFQTYADLRPTTKLVDGRLLAWSSVIWGMTVIVCWAAALFGAATFIFRRRELATYSGQ